MTTTEFVVCPDTVTCHRCHVEQDTGWPVALIAQVQGRGLYACVGCVREVEGVAR